MTSNSGDGQPPSDPYREGPADPGGSTSGEPAGPPPEPPPGYWQQQSQSPGQDPQASYGDQQPQYGQPQYGQPAYGQQPPYGQPYPPYPVAPPNHGGALASMIVGIVGLVLSCAYGFGLLASPVAWYLGSKSLKEIDASQGRFGGRGMAQAGKIMGIIGTVLLVLVIIAVIVIVIIVAANSGSSDF